MTLELGDLTEFLQKFQHEKCIIKELIKKQKLNLECHKCDDYHSVRLYKRKKTKNFICKMLLFLLIIFIVWLFHINGVIFGAYKCNTFGGRNCYPLSHILGSSGTSGRVY